MHPYSGPAGETFARSFAAAIDGPKSGEPYATPRPLPLDDLLIGTHRSRSSSSLITDSAAGATAFSCGLKSYNGAIGVDAKARKCGTIFEAAKAQLGMLTGVVVTSRITDATPAAFVAHVASRAEEPEIAAQEILGTVQSRSKGRATDRTLDLAIGGGGCNLFPQTHGLSCRTDTRDLLQEAQATGWNVHFGYALNSSVASQAASAAVQAIGTAEHGQKAAPHLAVESFSEKAFEAQQASLPWLGFITPFNTPFEIDRVEIDEAKRPPSLASMARKALHLLDTDKSNEKGFMLMIEGSQIDICAHSNDGACHAREILAYQEAIAEVRKFVEHKNRLGERTILLSTSDHETGGLTLGRQLTPAYPNYAWYPDRLTAAKASAQVLSAHLVGYVDAAQRSEEEVRAFIRDETLGRGAGFGEKTGGAPTGEEIALVHKCLRAPEASTKEDPPIDVRDVCRALIAETMSRRAEIGWSTCKREQRRSNNPSLSTGR